MRSVTTRQPTDGRVAVRRTRTRAALLDAAERAFTRGGFNGVTMDQLAAEADVSVGAIYDHFAGKDGLYLAVAARAAETFNEYISRAYTVSSSPLEQVMAAGHAYLRLHLEHPGLFRFIAYDGVESRPPTVGGTETGAAAATVAATLDGFRERIAAAVAAGEVADYVDPEITARVLFAAWNGMVALGLRTDGLRLDDDAIASCIQQARRLVVEGLSTPAARGEDGYTRVRLLELPSPK